MLDLVPAQVADMYKAFYTVLKLGENTEVGDIADSGFLLASDWIFVTDVLPWIRSELLESERDRKSTRLNSSHQIISYAVFCLKKKKEACRVRSCNGAEETTVGWRAIKSV